MFSANLGELLSQHYLVPFFGGQEGEKENGGGQGGDPVILSH